jgi:GNAT superfamily N-acetyltransferase
MEDIISDMREAKGGGDKDNIASGITGKMGLSRQSESKIDYSFYKPLKRHRVEIKDDSGKTIASMEWMNDDGQISHLDVKPEYRRKGLATKLFQKARELSEKDDSIASPQHSPMRSEDGDAWARAIGGNIPDRDR